MTSPRRKPARPVASEPEDREVAASSAPPLRGLLDQVHDAVVATDLNGTVLTWNAAAERIYGYTAAEMIGRAATELYFPGDRSPTAEWTAEQLRVSGVAEAELRSRRKDGSEIFVALRVTLHRDDSGELIGTIGCANDVTERYRARSEERRQREELRVILDHMPAMVWYKDGDNNIVRANAAAAASVGLSTTDIEGRSTAELFPDHAERYHRDDLAVIRSGVAKLGIVEPLQVAGGATRWVRTDKLPYRDERGEIVGVLVFAVDITDQKLAERALEQARDTLEQHVQTRTAELAEAVAHLRREVAQRQQAEERLAMALWATDLGMWDWDARTRLSVWDARLIEMLGFTADEVPQPNDLWETLTHPDDLAVTGRAWHAHVTDGRTAFYEVEHRLRTKSGEYRWMLTRGKVVERAADGRALRLVGTNRDITARKEIEEQAARHQAELAHLLRLQTVNCLAAELAHEINQPLGAIANYANGLAERLRQGQIDRLAMLEAAEHIGGQAMRAGTVLQRLREFVRKDSPRQRVEDLNRLIASAVGFVEPEARRLSIAVVLQLAPRLPPVRVDAIQIEQVLVNLLRNGLDAITDTGAAHGELTVTSAATDAGGVEVRVRDTGGGVPAAVRDRLFEPFFTTKAEGLGMGLSISRSIVDAHGGAIHVESHDRAGATFSFTIPPDSMQPLR